MEEFYDETGSLTESIEICPGGPVVGLNIPIGSGIRSAFWSLER